MSTRLKTAGREFDMDQRENILSRLVAVCGAVEGVANAVRNRLDVGTLERPTVVILDGSEHFADAPSTSFYAEIQRMQLAPAISIHVRGSDLADGGSLLSIYRSRVLAAILSDATLNSYVTNQGDGRIRYAGSAVAVPAAEGKEYRIDLSLVFTYVLRLSDIAAAEGRGV
jgi:hypothetical protein